MNYERKEHHPSRRVDRASHEAREASIAGWQSGVDDMSLDEMVDSGLVHSNIYGERTEGYPGQGEHEYDAFEDPRGDYLDRYAEEGGDAPARGLM